MSAGRPAPSGDGDGFIVREMEPQNLESPASAFSAFLTPTERFYVRSHFKQPELSVAAWTLTVDGAVSTPLHIDYAGLLAMPSKTLVSMLECAGNGRVYLVPKADGAQWANGGMGNAEWVGVPVAALLQRAGVTAGAVDVVFEGADSGELTSDPKSPGPISFARSISIAEALHGDALLAFRMNGSPLTGAHGFPVRVVVPGWYGMASVKWLKRITVTEKPFDGYFQSLQYSYFQRSNGIPTLLPITAIGVKSAIMRPAFGERLAPGRPYTVSGNAWAGLSEVASVEVSTDGGATWQQATMTTPAVRYSWRMWQFQWTPARAGSYKLMARAKDAHGHQQPMDRNKDLRSYQITHVIPISVEVG